MVYIFTIQNMSMSNLQSCCSTRRCFFFVVLPESSGLHLSDNIISKGSIVSAMASHMCNDDKVQATQMTDSTSQVLTHRFPQPS